ncbi:MAG: hypothetical protein KHY89_01655 [Butyricicoccus pullicaecorum]|nr:hypothetical protein [Butyricicoccus pullicaecorum]
MILDYLYSGENAAGTNELDVYHVIENWMNSSGHRANILDPDAGRIGIAVSNHNWIQLVARAVS